MRELHIEDRKKVSLLMLKEFHQFCVNNGIQYFLAYGTLLGAIRHNGFIPWDDDVDVYLMREEYNKLVSKWHHERYNLVTCDNTKTYYLSFGKITDTRTARKIGDVILEDEGLGIDLFPLDGAPEDIQELEKQYRKFHDHVDKYHNKFIAYGKGEYSNGRPVTGIKRLIGKVMVGAGFLSWNTRRLAKVPLKVASGNCPNVWCLSDMYPTRMTYYRRDVFVPEKHLFEGEEFFIPKEYDKVLSFEYGDYMQLPPEEKRISTHQDTFVWKE